MKKTITIISLVLFANSAQALPKVVLGEDATVEYINRAADAKTLVQRKKGFLLAVGEAEEKINKSAFTLKVGEPLYILNDEKKYVHNVYDTQNKNWVIQKQKPSDVSVVTYDKKGVHKLKCAIHPKMRVTVNVE